MAQCVIRRVKEETGLDINITGLLGICTDPHHVIAYADDEVRQEFNVTYLGRVVGGTIAASDESTDVRFIDPADFDDIRIHETVRLRRRAPRRSLPASIHSCKGVAPEGIGRPQLGWTLFVSAPDIDVSARFAHQIQP